MILLIAAIVVVVLLGVGAFLLQRRRTAGSEASPPPPVLDEPMTGLEAALDRATDRSGRPLSDRLGDERVDDFRVPDDTGPLLRRALDHVEHHPEQPPRPRTDGRDDGSASPTDGPETGCAVLLDALPTGTLPTMDHENTDLEHDADVGNAATGGDELVDELLIEEISIDGMCGVY